MITAAIWCAWIGASITALNAFFSISAWQVNFPKRYPEMHPTSGFIGTMLCFTTTAILATIAVNQP